MFKKINIKYLLIAFVILLAIVVLIKFIESKKGERTIKTELVSFEVEDINSIKIITRNEKDDALSIYKQGEEWKVEQKGEIHNADENKVTNLLNELLKIKPERLAAVSKDKWKDFEVTDSLSVRVIAIKDDKKLSDIYIGKFSYQNPTNPYERQGKMTTYVRLAEDKEVYAVDGFLRMTFNSDINTYRNNKIIEGNRSDWTKLTFDYPADSSFTLSKQNDKWMLNGLLADSAKVARYLSSISYTTSSNFVEDSLVVLKNVTHSLKIEGNNMMPIEVSAIPGDSTHGYFITSSINKGTYFSGLKANVFEKIFKGEGHFFSE